MSEKAGDILLRLGYLPSAEKLTVVLLKARFLNEVDADGEKKPPGPKNLLFFKIIFYCFK